MPERKSVPSLSETAESIVIANIKKVETDHKNWNCCYGFNRRSFLKLYWFIYYKNTGKKVGFDCPKIIQTVDFILSYLSPNQLRQEFGYYLSAKNTFKPKVSIGNSLLELLGKESHMSWGCPRIKHLVEVHGIKYLSCSGNDAYLHFLPVCKDLVILDLCWCLFANDKILRLVGEKCHYLEEIRNIDVTTISVSGLKEMLYYDFETKAKRRICRSLKVITNSARPAMTEWADLPEYNRDAICEKWFLIMSCCPNATLTLGYYSDDILTFLYKNKNNFIHSKVKSVEFEKPSDESLDLISRKYPNITHMKLSKITGKIDNLSKFKKVTSLNIECLYQKVEPFLKNQGRVLRKLQLNSCDPFLTLDLNELAAMCPNLFDMNLVAKWFHFQNHATSFKYLEKLRIQKQINDNDNLQWFADFVASLTNLNMLDIGSHIATSITDIWIDNTISYGSLQNLECMRMPCSNFLIIDDMKRWLYACPKLKELKFASFMFLAITHQEWIDFEAEIQNQNYGLKLDGSDIYSLFQDPEEI